MVKDLSNAYFAQFEYYDEEIVGLNGSKALEFVKRKVTEMGLLQDKLRGVYNYEESVEVRKTLPIR